MSPLTDRSKAKESGFAQVREALLKFEGTVASAEFGQWGGQLVDEDGNKLPVREFLEVVNTDVEVLEVSEELAMPIDEWSFRVNCSEYKGSFWVEKFLEAADNAKIQIPDELGNQRIVWEKVTLLAKDPKFNSTNFVIAEVKGEAKAKPKVVKAQAEEEEPVDTEEEAEGGAIDWMEAALELAVGKTEQQFKSAFSLKYPNSPVVSLAKAGALTLSLVNEGKLVVVKEGNKEIYQLPE